MITSVMVRFLFQNKNSELNLLFRIYYLIAFLLTFTVLFSLILNKSVYEKPQIADIQTELLNTKIYDQFSKISYEGFTQDEILLEKLLGEKFQNGFFSINRIKETKKVPNIIISRLPKDFGKINSSTARKTLFTQIMLPLIVKENEYLVSQNLKTQHLKNRFHLIKRKEALWLDQKMKEYKVQNKSIDDLLIKVDAIPVSIALSQAAVESGWGTSRFAYEGNALYGQYIWKRGEGIVPEERNEDDRHEIKSFKNLKSSVSSYMKNLNSNFHYEEFRINRFIMRVNGIPLNGIKLSEFLYNYSTDENYPNKIRGIIKTNNFEDFDNVKIDNSSEEAITLDII